jgi:cation transport ATPase
MRSIELSVERIADLGLAVVCCTDVALGAADLILMRTDLTIVPNAIRLARTTLRTIHGNRAWDFRSTSPRCRWRRPVCSTH